MLSRAFASVKSRVNVAAISRTYAPAAAATFSSSSLTSASSSSSSRIPSAFALQHQQRRALHSTSAMLAKKKAAAADDEREASFTVSRPFKFHKIDEADQCDNNVTATAAELKDYYFEMAYYRRFEIVCSTLYRQRLIRGFCHLYDGQEAIVTGMEAAINKTDSVITAYRDHCHQIARGDTGESVMSELMGKSTGCSRGKGGSMHMYFPENNFYGGNGIVGAQVPLGGGLAFAHKYNKDGGVAIAKYGDGAANQGQITETANMAALWKLPLIFVCENNEFGMGTSMDRGSAACEFYKRGDYVPGIWCDGMDVLAMKKAFAFAAEWCRSGKGPIFLEASTYRYHGHSMSDPGVSYRSREDVDEQKRTRDCIASVKEKLIDNGFATAAELKAVDKQIRVKVDEAVTFAKAQEELPPSGTFEDVYCDKPPEFIRTPNFFESVVAKQ